MNWFTDGDEGSFESSLFFLDQQQQQQQQTMKEEQIRQCLSAPENIDLWELRKLAISKGGLLSEKWRQQAWNKFVASHESIWKNAQQRTTQQQVVAYHHPTQQDIREIRQLVQKAVWSLQPIRSRCKIQNKKEVLLQLTTANLSSSPQEQQHSKEELQVKNDGNNNGLKMDKEERNKETQPFHHNNHHIEKLNTNSGLRRRVSFDMPESTDGGNTPIHDSTTKEERQTLRKILIHLKRTNPTFSQFPGIQNLVAILCIVFQSPSVTSLVVQKMISHHWNTNHNGGDDRDLYMRILQRFDPELYLLWSSQYWIYSTPHPIRSSWIPCWFSQDIFKLNILLRIWDVFLVSHPHFPIYFSVALTRHFRTTFLSSPSNENIDKLISVLPALLNEETTEQVILRAFQCMQQYPPPSSTLSTFPSWYWASKTPSDFVVVQRAKTLREQQQQSILTPTIGGHIEDTGSNMTISLPIIADAQCALAVLATTGRIRTYGNISYLKRQKRHWLLQLFGLGCAIIALLILTIGSTNEGWMMASSISSTSNNWKEETSSMLAPLLQREQTPSVNNETSAIELTSQHKIEKLQAAERDVLGEDGTANANSTPLEERALSASGLVIPLPKTHTGDDGEKETLLLSDKRELFLDVVDLAKYGKLRKEGNDLGNNPLVRETKRHGTRNEEKDFQVNHRMQVQNPILFKNGRTGEQVQDRADIGHEPSDGAAHLSNDKIDSQSQNPRKEDINQQAGFQTQQKDQTDSISKDYNVAEQQGYDNKDAAPWNEGREKEDTGFQEEEEIPTSTERAEQNEATLTRQDVTRKPLLLQPSDVGATLRASQEIIDRLNEIQMMLDFEMDTKPSPVPNPMHAYVKRLKNFVAHKRESAIKSLRRKIDKG